LISAHRCADSAVNGFRRRGGRARRRTIYGRELRYRRLSFQRASNFFQNIAVRAYFREIRCPLFRLERQGRLDKLVYS
jgi:hypothetical protein